jgi:hypothetical protein
VKLLSKLQAESLKVHGDPLTLERMRRDEEGEVNAEEERSH